MKQGQQGEVTPVPDHILLKQSYSSPEGIGKAFLDISMICGSGALEESGLRCAQKRKQKGHFWYNQTLLFTSDVMSVFESWG